MDGRTYGHLRPTLLGRLGVDLKMETRHPIGGLFGREFFCICNHCGVMTAWSRKTWKFLKQFLRFFRKNDPLWQNFQNSVWKVFTASPIDVVVFKCRKVCPMGNRWNCALFTSQTKFRLPLKLPLLRRSRPKSARASPNIWLTMFQISSKSVHFWWSYSWTRDGHFLAHRVFAIFIFGRTITNPWSIYKHLLETTKHAEFDLNLIIRVVLANIRFAPVWFPSFSRLFWFFCHTHKQQTGWVTIKKRSAGTFWPKNMYFSIIKWC